MIINKHFLAEYSPLPRNYDYSEIMNYVGVAEEIYVKPLIGCNLYSQIEDEVEENKISEPIAALLTEGKLYQYLAFATCLEGLPMIWSHFSETGISLGKSENTDSVSLKDITYIENHLRKQVEFLKDSVKRYIIKHYEYFNIDDECECACSMRPMDSRNNFNQIYTTYREDTNLC